MRSLEELLSDYDRDHQHPTNRALHMIGITLIGTSVVVVWVIPPLGLALFLGGWLAQFIGHAVEGKKPSFTRDPRYMAVGALWYRERVRDFWARLHSRTSAGESGKLHGP